MTVAAYHPDSSFTIEESNYIHAVKRRIQNFQGTSLSWQLSEAITRGDIVLVGNGMHHFFIEEAKSTFTSLSVVCLESTNEARWHKFFMDNRIMNWEHFQFSKDYIRPINIPMTYSHVFTKVLAFDLIKGVGSTRATEPMIKDIKLFLATDKLKTRDDIIKYQVDTAPKISYTESTLYISRDAFQGIPK